MNDFQWRTTQIIPLSGGFSQWVYCKKSGEISRGASGWSFEDIFEQNSLGKSWEELVE